MTALRITVMNTAPTTPARNAFHQLIATSYSRCTPALLRIWRATFLHQLEARLGGSIKRRCRSEASHSEQGGMGLGPSFKAERPRPLVEGAVRAMVAAHRLPQVIGPGWIFGAVVLLRVVSGSSQKMIGE